MAKTTKKSDKKEVRFEDIVLKTDTVLSTIDKTNKSLKGALPDNYSE